MKLKEVADNPALYRLTPNRDGYDKKRLKSLFGDFIVYYDNKKLAGPMSAIEAANALEKHLSDNFPDLKLPLLYHSEDKSNNLSVSDSEGEYMDAELKQVGK